MHQSFPETKETKFTGFIYIYIYIRFLFLIHFSPLNSQLVTWDWIQWENCENSSSTKKINIGKEK